MASPRHCLAVLKLLFTRDALNRLWVNDITEHRTNEGKVYCAVVLDTFSRRVVGWLLDSGQTAALVANALGMAISNRAPSPMRSSTPITECNSPPGPSPIGPSGPGWFPSMGSIGDCYDNAMIESFWGGMQTELLNRRRWKTRIELANAIFDYLEIFHNRQHHHFTLGMHTPIEFELLHQSAEHVA